MHPMTIFKIATVEFIELLQNPKRKEALSLACIPNCNAFNMLNRYSRSNYITSSVWLCLCVFTSCVLLSQCSGGGLGTDYQLAISCQATDFYLCWSLWQLCSWLFTLPEGRALVLMATMIVAQWQYFQAWRSSSYLMISPLACSVRSKLSCLHVLTWN